jgi:hypothetical protein
MIPALAMGAGDIGTPHLERTTGAVSVSLQGQTFINQGLVGSGQLAAGTVDFLGDTLGSFSALQLRSWKRVGDGYEGVLWTLPDRGRNDPAANLFFDYSSRLHRFRIRYSPHDGKLVISPDGGLQLRDYRGQPFTGADPGRGLLTQHGLVLPAPADGTGAGRISLDAESLQFTRDGAFYVGDEYTANVYYFDSRGRLRGVIQAPPAIAPRSGRPEFGSLAPPQSGRRNNQGVEGISLAPDGRTLFVMLQSALMQDSAAGNASGRVNARVLVYDLRATPTPAAPVRHHVVQLPALDEKGAGHAPNRTAAQSEIRALNDHQFLMLARDGAGLGAAGSDPIVFKSILIVDTDDATNLAGTAYESGVESVLQQPDRTALRPGINAARSVEFINMLNPVQLARLGLGVDALSEKWEAMDLVPALDPSAPNDYLLFVGNDNDFIARHCRMVGQVCDSALDNDNRVLVYRVTLPAR